jgi:hypothetical protein
MRQGRRYTGSVPTERLMLLDGYGLVYRGYYARPPVTTSRGELVNGVFGFASIVLGGSPTCSRTTWRSHSTCLVHVPARPVRRVQGHATADAGRPS